MTRVHAGSGRDRFCPVGLKSSRHGLKFVTESVFPSGWKEILNKRWHDGVNLTDDQKAFVRQAIESGRYRGEEDALREALSLWEGRERRRAEILAAVDRAEASFARGEGRRITTREEAIQLSDEIKTRGLARLTPEQGDR